MIAPSSLSILRQARILVDRAKNGPAEQLRADLYELARLQPRRTAELLVVLAEIVGDVRPAFPDLAHEEHLLRARSAYNRGERDKWVVAGNREWERLRKRRYRWLAQHEKNKGAA